MSFWLSSRQRPPRAGPRDSGCGYWEHCFLLHNLMGVYLEYSEFKPMGLPPEGRGALGAVS